MRKISLLDCTLRDGGYVNDWKFGQANLISVFERLVDAKVDIIEIGFLDERRPFDFDRSIMPNTDSADKIYGTLDAKQSMLVGMIDFGTCGIENLKPCEQSCLKGIRVIFKKHLMRSAMEFCHQIKELGYKVFSQLVSITSYNDAELLELAALVNDVKPYAVSMVDTYGLMHPNELLHYYDLLDKNVTSEVQIGFHAHNNFQLAYANALTFITKETHRDIVVDGTLYGMGKSAGNAPLELIAMRLNEKFESNYRIDSMLEAIQESIIDFYAKTPWGYKTFFYLCGLNKCHPNYLTYFEQKGNLSTSKIDYLLSQIEPEEKKLLYDKQVAEKLYEKYMQGECSDEMSKNSLKREIYGKKLLVIGPGKNMVLQREKVEQFIKKQNPYLISINYVPESIMPNCIFVTKTSRYHDMTLKLKELEKKGIKLLATTNVESRNSEFNYVVNRTPLLEQNERITDNSFLMLIHLLMSIGIQEISCAGFDGYSDQEDNYCNPAMEYTFVKQETVYLNSHMKEKISEFREKIKIEFVTYSAYDVEEDIHGAAI